MVVRLSTTAKIRKVEQALKIINYSIINKVKIAKASKHYKKDRRFVYDVHRRWIKNTKNNVIPYELIAEFKNKFNPKNK